ncbi:tyrosine-type recombinase/integrase [Priestia megaterium]|uniref:tyrosine-type recombinase/integrase n=1 Tax=Priestia megaterium TaxID=1404 RepID=UPI002E1B504E|nr:tyrosine-type recombinase/integrase [Priestia megaterium]MED4284941.1 tyrosine-type recombinase/integrase [Priestia megaterium]
MNIKDVLELYKQHMKNKNLADSTYNQYVKELGYFINFLSDQHIERVNEIKAIHIDMFNAQLIREGNKATTRSRKKSIINKYFDYCIKMEIIEKNPSNIIGSIKVTDDDRKKKDILTDKDKEKILKKIEKKSKFKLKNKCIVQVLLYCAVRVSELCGLKWEDIDFQNKTISIKGKGRKNRRVPLFKELEDDLKKLRSEQVPKSEFVFTAKNTGNPMKPRSVHDLIKKYTSSINKNIGPHRLRATAATDYLREGVNLRYIQMLLGHESLATTMLYMNPDEQEMNQALQSAAKNMRKKGKKK